MTEKQEAWSSRVADWRASGKTAAAFSARHGLSANSLRWWASRLQRKGTVVPDAIVVAAPASPVVRLAKVVRAPESTSGFVRGTIVIEMLDARVRLLVNAGVDRETLATVLDLVERGAAR